MDKYLFTSLHANRRILLGYEAGILREFTLEGPVSMDEIRFLKEELPWMESSLREFEHVTRGKVTRVDPDLSFAAFWSAYAYKVGNKIRAERIWDKLSDPDKALALRSIPLYDRFLAFRQNQDKAYAETYLSQRRFENTYKIY